MGSDGRAARWLAALVALATGGAALAADVTIVPAEGRLRPGRAALVYVAADAGTPPPLSTDGGAVEPLGAVAEGVEAWRLRPPLDASAVRLRAGGVERAVPVELPEPSGLRLPRAIEGIAGGGPVVFRVTGDALPPPAALQVAAGEGAVVGVTAVDGALEVRLEPDDAPYPRVIPVGVRDARRDERPVWGLVRLEARPSIPLETEPGAVVRLRLGDRDYGPFEADAAGQVRARVSQRPGEGHATAVITDALGNETWTELPLAVASHPVLAALPEGEIVAGEPPPAVWIRAIRADGRRVGEAPTCRSLAGELPGRPIEGDVHLLAIPETVGDLRVDCNVAGSVHAFRVPFADGVAARIRTHVWPADLRADHPVAEFEAVLEDGRGVVLSPEGLSLRAERGHVDARVEGHALRGAYEGHAAVKEGEDVVVARWTARGRGAWPHRLVVGWEPAHDGARILHARALDPRRLPVPDVPIVFEAGGALTHAVTGEDGWATARVAGEARAGVEVIRVVAPFREHAAPIPAGTRRDGPGTPDLVARSPVRILPGQTVGIALDVLPPVLRAGPGARARIRISLEDRAGARVEDRPVELDVSDGAVGRLLRRADGTWVAEYDPGRVDRSREIVVTARTDDLRSSTTFRVEPRSVRLAVGPWAGVHTNLGAVTAPVFGVDGELRVRSEALGEALALRLGVATYRFETSTTGALDGDWSVRSRVVPASAALAVRQDLGALDVVAGAGGAVGVHAMEVFLDGRRQGGGSVLLAGPAVLAGLARELLGGEIALTLRGTWLIQKRGEVGLDGNVGGISTGLGYHLVF